MREALRSDVTACRAVVYKQGTNATRCLPGRKIELVPRGLKDLRGIIGMEVLIPTRASQGKRAR